MANKFYAVREGRVRGIYLTWDEAKKNVDGFSGAVYKSFKTREEAEEFMNVSDAFSKSYENLMKVEVKEIGSIDDARQILTPYEKKVNALLEESYLKPVDVVLMGTSDRVLALKEKYGISLLDNEIDSDAPVFFVDGGGDKSGPNYISNNILFGVVELNPETKETSLYRNVLSRGEDFDWLFRMSNVAGEELSALLAMYVAAKKGYKKFYIYQDNNLPAKYFTGEFRRINNADDYMLMLFISESAKYLKNDLDIRFVYVPSEHSKTKTVSEKKAMYEKQSGKMLPFEVAEFYNAISDALADYTGKI